MASALRVRLRARAIRDGGYRKPPYSLRMHSRRLRRADRSRPGESVRVRRGGERESGRVPRRSYAVTLSRVLPARCLTSTPEGASVMWVDRAGLPLNGALLEIDAYGAQNYTRAF